MSIANNGILIQNDAELFQGYFKEVARLRGIKVLYSYVLKESFTIHAEPINLQYADPVETYIIFETNPKTATLKKLGWVSELPEDKPYIAMLPIDVLNLTKNCKISIPPYRSLGSAKDFLITDIGSILEFPDCWICKLAPIFDNSVPQTDYSAQNFNYIKDDRT
jgi:hypothetical protein